MTVNSLGSYISYQFRPFECNSHSETHSFGAHPNNCTDLQLRWTAGSKEKAKRKYISSFYRQQRRLRSLPIRRRLLNATPRPSIARSPPQASRPSPAADRPATRPGRVSSHLPCFYCWRPNRPFRLHHISNSARHRLHHPLRRASERLEPQGYCGNRVGIPWEENRVKINGG